MMLLLLAIVGCTTIDELTNDATSTSGSEATAIPDAPLATATPSPQEEFESLAKQLNTKGLITQSLVDDLLAQQSRLGSINPEVNDPEVAMQVLADFNEAVQAWGDNITQVLDLSQSVLGQIDPQGRAGLHSPLLVSCNDVVSLNNTMDKIQKDVDVAKTARDRMLAVDRDKDFGKFETEFRNWRTSYKTANTTANNELVMGPLQLRLVLSWPEQRPLE